MAIRVRTFLNTDLPILEKLWQSHCDLAGLNTPCPSSTWESCVVAKCFFDSQGMLIAQDDDIPVGFVHAIAVDPSEQDDASRRHGLVNSLCIHSHSNEDHIADQLLNAASQYFENQAGEIRMATSSPSMFAFYLGIAEGDGMMGVPAQDQRLQRWLNSAGFTPTYPTEVWEMELSHFRPPMDRNQMMIRRQFQVSRVLEESKLSWYHANVLGHTEQVRFQLTNKQPTGVDAEVMFWQPDLASAGVHQGAMRLWCPDTIIQPDNLEKLVFLLTEALRQLQLELIGMVRAVVRVDQAGLVRLLQRLGFRSRTSGITFEKVKNPPPRFEHAINRE